MYLVLLLRFAVSLVVRSPSSSIFFRCQQSDRRADGRTDGRNAINDKIQRVMSCGLHHPGTSQ